MDKVLQTIQQIDRTLCSVRCSLRPLLSLLFLTRFAQFMNDFDIKQAASLNRARQYRLAHFISLNFRDPHFGLFWGLGLLLGYLATSSAKSDVGFLLSDPGFL